MLLDVVKALFYTCSSFPKICAPHRLSPSDDYEICMLTSMVGALGIYGDVRRIVLEYKMGERDIGRLEIGRNLGKALLLCHQELGYRASIELCVSSVMLSYIDVLQTEVEREFHKAVKRLFNAMQVPEVNDVLEFVRIAKSIGGDLYLLLDKAGISEKKAMVEALSIQNLFEELSKHEPAFEPFSNVQKVLEVVRLAGDLFHRYGEMNSTLAKLFLELAKDHVEIPSDRVAELIKVDSSYRRRGVRLTYLMPYIAYASLYLVKTR